MKLLQKREATNPFAFMRRITDELDRAFGADPEFPALTPFYARVWAPQLEVFERDNKFFVRVDLPGLKKEEVKIQFTPDELTIEGERKLDKEEQEKGFYRSERVYGKFLRQIALPEYVKAEAAVATFKDGVLVIEMPTLPVPELKTRTLEIKG
jgi:HSP20 family protein